MKEVVTVYRGRITLLPHSKPPNRMKKDMVREEDYFAILVLAQEEGCEISRVVVSITTLRAEPVFIEHPHSRTKRKRAVPLTLGNYADNSFQLLIMIKIRGIFIR